MPGVTCARWAGRYEGALERAIGRLKYDGRRPLARPLAALLRRSLAEALPDLRPDLVLAVPLHPRRQRVRGFNQSELIARELRHLTGWAGGRSTLVRVRATPPQVGLDRVRRRDNVRGAFAWRGPSLEGASVLLLDDVMTTGATLGGCARVLGDAGATEVIAFTVARVGL